MQLLRPSNVASRAFPKGLPVVSDVVQRRLGFFTSSLDADATAGDPGLFGPDSETWASVGHISQALAGLRAALLQGLSAPILTATHSTGSFYEDFLGRVGRTGAFVQKQNLGSMDEMYRSARRVRAMHRTIAGTWKNGTEFDASDPHQQAWVSMTLTDSYLAIGARFGHGPLPRTRADRLVREQSTHGALLDPRVDLDAIFADPDQRAALQAGTLPLPLIEEGELPTTVAQLQSLKADWAKELQVTDLTRMLLDATVGLTELEDPQRSLGRAFVLATLSTIDDDLHELLAPTESRIEEAVAAEAVQVPLAVLHLLLGRSPAIDIARRRVRTGAST